MQTIYVENALKDHPRVDKVISRYKKSRIIFCDHYGEIFNAKGQNYRLQKKNTAIILAKKQGRLVLPTPEGFGIGGKNNYYFSHMLNCVYDCRYCFLQGMYNSAYYVLFVNYEDFMAEITEIASQHAPEPLYFFSGYDADSLVFEPVSGFLGEFLPFFSTIPNAILELRTKSTNVRELLKNKPIKNCVVAFSFTPKEISEQVEHKVPSLKKRLAAMQAVANQGWQIGLRLDPLIHAHNFSELYQTLVFDIFSHLKVDQLHSVSVGALRFPLSMYQQIVKLYPQDKLLAHPLEKTKNYYAYREALEKDMKQCVLDILKNYVDDALVFECRAV